MPFSFLHALNRKEVMIVRLSMDLLPQNLHRQTLLDLGFPTSHHWPDYATCLSGKHVSILQIRATSRHKTCDMYVLRCEAAIFIMLKVLVSGSYKSLIFSRYNVLHSPIHRSIQRSLLPLKKCCTWHKGRQTRSTSTLGSPL